MNNRFAIKINIPITLLIVVLSVYFVCRYKVLAGTSAILMLAELVCIAVLCSISRIDSAEYDFRIIWFHIAFMLYRIVLSLISKNAAFEGARRILIYEMGPLVMVGLFILIEGVQKAVRVVKVICIVNIVIALYEYLFRSSLLAGFIDDAARIGKYTFGTSSYRVRTIFIHPIICAVFFTVCWVVVAFYPIKNKVIDILVKTLIIVCLIGTQARSSWISFAIISVIIAFAYTTHNKRTTTKSRVLFFILLVIAISFFILVSGSRFKEASDIIVNRWMDGMDKNSDAYYNRVYMIKMGLEVFNRSSIIRCFFGNGNGFALAFLKAHAIHGWKAAVDNTFITVLLDYGIIGLAFLLYYFVLVLKNIFNQNVYCRMAAAALLTILISGWFYDMFNWFTTDTLMALSICFMAYKNKNNNSDDGCGQK